MSDVSALLGVVGPLGAIIAMVVGLGRVLQQIGDVRTEQERARTESRSQHEETRREIASLREDRVRSQVLAEAQGHRIAELEVEVRALRERVHALSRSAQGDAV